MQKGYSDYYKGFTDLNTKCDQQVQAILSETQKQAWQDLAKKNPYWQWNVPAGGGWTLNRRKTKWIARSRPEKVNAC